MARSGCCTLLPRQKFLKHIWMRIDTTKGIRTYWQLPGVQVIRSLQPSSLAEGVYTLLQAFGMSIHLPFGGASCLAHCHKQFSSSAKVTCSVSAGLVPQFTPAMLSNMTKCTRLKHKEAVHLSDGADWDAGHDLPMDNNLHTCRDQLREHL